MNEHRATVSVSENQCDQVGRIVRNPERCNNPSFVCGTARRDDMSNAPGQTACAHPAFHLNSSFEATFLKRQTSSDKAVVRDQRIRFDRTRFSVSSNAC